MSAMRRILLVEGIDDLHVTASLLKQIDFPEVFEIRERGGIENLMQALQVQLKASGLERLGIVVDADLKIADRWAAVRDILSTVGYEDIPKEPDQNGTILNPLGKPRFGAWIMPNNSSPGMLEDFVSYLVPENCPLFAHAGNAIDNIAEGDRNFSMQHKVKAHLHTWLAWQEDPGTPMGLAITKKYLNSGADEVSSFLEWLKALFVD